MLTLSVIIVSSLMLSSIIYATVKPIRTINAQILNSAASSMNATTNTLSNNTTSNMGMANNTASSNLAISGNGTVQVLARAQLAESREPVAPSAEQLRRFEQSLNETFPYPKQLVKIAPSQLVQRAPPANSSTYPSIAPPSLDINASELGRISNATGSQSIMNASSSNNNNTAMQNTTQLQQQQLPIKIYKSSIVQPTQYRSTIGEPSLANNKDTIFYTGNWFAARSTNFGTSWGYINPLADMPDYCCDQDVIYDQAHGVFFWYRQGTEDSNGEDRFLLSVSKDALTWWSYSIKPTVFNTAWNHQWFDYPHLALSNNYLWISSNVFDQSGNFVRTVMFRWNLNQLSLGQTVNFQYFFETNQFTYTPVQGVTTDTMYWATHDSSAVGSKERIYVWGPGSPRVFTVTVPTWTFGARGISAMSCPAPDGRDWCARADSRVTGGWIGKEPNTGKEIIGFLWNARQGGSFKYPFVYIVTFYTNNGQNIVYRSNPILWHPNFAWLYGFASPIPGSTSLGMVTYFGGGLFYPSISAGIVDSAAPLPPPYQLVVIGAGNNGASEWGDYARTRAFNGTGPIWIGGADTLQGCTDGSCIEPRFFAFGR